LVLHYLTSGLGKENFIKKMNDKQKFITLIVALMCNFTFLANAQNNEPTAEAKKLPECIKSHGEDSIETRRTMSVLQEDYKNRDYFYAYKWFTYMFTKAPCAYKTVYLYGQYTIKELIADSNYAKRKENLVDTLLMIFPTRIKYFGEEGLVKGTWAFNLGKFRPDSIKTVLSLYKDYVNSERDNLDDVIYIRDYMRNAVNGHIKKLLTKEELFNIYDLLSTVSEENKIKYGADDSTQYLNWNNTIILMDSYMSQFLKCADIDAIYAPKIKSDPDNIELTNKVIKLYKTAGSCNDNANFVALLEKSFALSPNAIAAEGLANYFEKKGNNSKANDYFEKAADLSTDPKKKEDLYIKLADKNRGNSSVAKSFARKALDINPNNGYAIIIIGSAIYSSACGDEFDKGMAACAAVEMFQKAKNLDPSVTADANKLIASYSKYFPTSEQVFFRGLKEGQSYSIPCSGVSAIIKVK
jgi:tetratricopeptide (TPR) repeat protein